MNKEELKQEANKYAKGITGKYVFMEHGRASALGYLAGAEPREKQIDELKAQIKVLGQNLEDTEICENGLKNRIAELEAKIEKMKRCEICEHSGTYLPICYSNEPCKNKDKFELRR